MTCSKTSFLPFLTSNISFFKMKPFWVTSLLSTKKKLNYFSVYSINFFAVVIFFLVIVLMRLLSPIPLIFFSLYFYKFLRVWSWLFYNRILVVPTLIILKSNRFFLRASVFHLSWCMVRQANNVRGWQLKYAWISWPVVVRN